MTLAPNFRVIQGSRWEGPPFTSQGPVTVGVEWEYEVIMGKTGVTLCSECLRAS